MIKVNESVKNHHLLGELAVELGFIDRDQLEAALRRQAELLPSPIISDASPAQLVVAKARRRAERKPRLGEILVDLEFMSPEKVDEALARQQDYFDRYRDLSNEALRTLMEIGVAVNSGMNPAELLELILDTANRLLAAEASTIMLLDEESGELVLTVPSGPKAEVLTDVRLPAGQGIAGWVLEHEEAAVVDDVENDDRFYADIDRQSGFVTCNLICVPMINRGRTNGVVEVMNKRGGDGFDDRDLLVLSRLADQAAAVVENARVYHELHNRMDQLLIREKERYRHLLDTLSVAVIAVDSEGAVIYVNRQVSTLIGLQQRDCIGRSFDELFIFRSGDGRRVPSGEVIEACRALPGEYLLSEQEGGGRWVSVSIAPLDTGPNRNGFQSIIQDIGREKEIRSRLFKVQQQGILGKLAGTLAWEINSPLQGIAAVLDLMRSHYPEDEWLLERVWELDRAFVRIRDTARQMTEMGRPGARQLQRLALNRPVEDAVALVRGYLQRAGVRHSLALADEQAELPLAPAMIGQALIGLIIGLMEKMEEKDRPRELRIATAVGENVCELTVEDSGPGFPSSVYGELTDISLTRDLSEGEGLGLTLCLAAAEIHGGSVRIASSPLGGSSLTMRFPRSGGEG